MKKSPLRKKGNSGAKEAFKKAKEKSVNYWKNRAWKVFSIFIRTRDADPEGFVKCVTCPRVMHWKQGDAGHFIAGRYNANLFDERGCHFQCKPCNGGLKDSAPKDVAERYEAYMLSRYGRVVVDELKTQNETRKQFTIPELQETINKYGKPK